MGRQSRRLIVRVLTLGIIICCCFTFFPRMSLSFHPSHVTNRQAEPKGETGSTKIITSAHAALKMETFIDSGNKIRKHISLDEDMNKFNDSKLFGHESIPGSKELPELCSQNANRPSYLKVKASIIISLVHLGSDDPVFLLSRILRQIPDRLTDDVIITAEDVMRDKVKQNLENAVELCQLCRLFFFEGTIYEHRNTAIKFSREDYLIFVDGRVIPDNRWLEPLLYELNFNHDVIVSPQLQLFDSKKAIADVSISRLEMTWDLNVFRAPLTNSQKTELQMGKLTAVNQSAVLKEVLGVQKDFFLRIGLFDIIPGVSGGEHVSLSMKVLNCGGEILMPVCSRVFLDISPQGALLNSSNQNDEEKKFHLRDYSSPSFRESKFNVTTYYDTNSKLWLDLYSSNIYSSSIHRQVNYNKSVMKSRISGAPKDSFVYTKYGKFANALRSSLMILECDVANYRYVIAKFQVNMLSPIAKTSYLGYIRSLDNMYAFGVLAHSIFFKPNSSLSVTDTKNDIDIQSHAETRVKMKHSYQNGVGHLDKNKTWLTFTRNSSLWIGPIAYVDGKLQYKRKWCVTVFRKRLLLELCQNTNSNQVFLFNDGVFRFATGGGKLCIKSEQADLDSNSGQTESIIKNLVVCPCDVRRTRSQNNPYVFVMDMEFHH